MSDLIGGKEAVKHLLDGREVLYIGHSYEARPNTAWGNALELSVEECIEDHWSFKLKPQTITINGIEVPKPDYIVDTPQDYDETWELNIGGMYFLYKTEESYNQVVEALRSIFK